MTRQLRAFVVNRLRAFRIGHVLAALANLASCVSFCCGTVILVLILSGCGQRKPDARAPDPMLMVPSEPAAAESSSSGAVPKAETNTATDLAALNTSLRQYVKLKKIIPKDLNELVASGFVRSLPNPPPGQKFAIVLHPLGYQVILINQ